MDDRSRTFFGSWLAKVLLLLLWCCVVLLLRIPGLKTLNFATGLYLLPFFFGLFVKGMIGGVGCL